MFAGDQLTVFARDAATGGFELVETERDGVDDPSDPGGPADGLSPARDLVVSPDGKFVYTAAGQPDNAVGVFERDPATGKVSFLEVERDGVDDPEDPGGTVVGMFRPEALAISPDGASVYVVTQADNSLVGFERDEETGRLSYQETLATGGWSADVEVTPDGAGVYVASDQGDQIREYSRAANGSLTYLGSAEHGVDGVTGLNNPQQIEISPDGDFVYVAGGGFSVLVVFKRDAGTQELTFVEEEDNEVDDPDDPGGTVTDLSAVSALAVSPDGENVYVTASGSDAVGTFELDPGEGEVSYVETHRTGVIPASGPVPVGLAYPEGIAVSPDGEHVYVGGGGQSGLVLFDRLAGGSLAFLLAEPEFTLRYPRGVAITPDGGHVLVGTLYGNSLHSLARDPVTGALEPRDTETEEVDDPSDPGPLVEGLTEPRAIAVAANGTDVYVTSTSTYSVSLFRLDPVDGELTYVETEFNEVNDPGDPGGEVFGLYEPWDIAISPDGTGLFTIGNSDDAVAAFDRDPATGRLSFVEHEEDGVGGVDGLNGAISLAIAPDGKTVYVVGEDDDAVAVFARDPATNQLTFLEVERDGVDDAGDPAPAVDGLQDPSDAALVAGGEALHVAGDAGIVRFDRDPATGLLSFAAVVDPSSLPGAPESASSRIEVLEPAPEGGELYAASGQDDGILFAHGLGAAGAIASLLDVEQPGLDDPDDPGPAPAALEHTEDLAISPDGRHLYAASGGENGLAIFDREPPPAPPAPPPAPVTPPPGSASAPIVAPVADNSLLGARFAVPRRQAQRGRKVVLKLRLRAGERARGIAWGRIWLGREGHPLRKATTALPAGKTRTLRLRPRRGAKRIAAALANGRKARAIVVARIVDRAGNQATRKTRISVAQQKLSKKRSGARR